MSVAWRIIECGLNLGICGYAICVCVCLCGGISGLSSQVKATIKLFIENEDWGEILLWGVTRLLFVSEVHDQTGKSMLVIAKCSLVCRAGL